MYQNLSVSENIHGTSRYIKIVSGNRDISVLADGKKQRPAEVLRNYAQEIREKAWQLTRRAAFVEAGAAVAEPVKGAAIFARSIAGLLESHLHRHNTSVHWVTAHGDDCTLPPVLRWPDDPHLSYLVREGSSEGVLVHVANQPVYHSPFELQPLLTIKLLGGPNQVLAELGLVRKFLGDLNADEIRKLNI